MKFSGRSEESCVCKQLSGPPKLVSNVTTAPCFFEENYKHVSCMRA